MGRILSAVAACCLVLVFLPLNLVLGAWALLSGSRSSFDDMTPRNHG